MSQQPAIAAEMVLDGLAIAHPTASWDVRLDPQKIVLRNATGDRRQQIAEPAAGFPTLKAKRTFTLGWSHLGIAKDQVETLLSDPGQHQLALWRPEYLQWLGDGVRAEYFMPNGWILATDYAPPPGGVAPAIFDAEIRPGLSGDVLKPIVLDQASYDAGDPAAGEVWFLEASSQLKLAAPPAAGEKIYGKVVPRYLVFEDGPQSTRLTGPIREPRELVLLEA